MNPQSDAPPTDELAHLRHRVAALETELAHTQRAHTALQTEANQYRRMMELMPEAVFVTDLAGVIVFANQRAAQLYRYETPEALIGTNKFDLVVSEFQAKAHRVADETHRRGANWNNDYAERRRDGTTFPAEVSALHVADLFDQPAAFFGIVRDISAWKEAEERWRESEAKYRLLAENMADVVWELNLTDGQFKYISPSVERLLGYTAAEVMRHPFAATLAPDSLTYLTTLLPARMHSALERPDVPAYYVDEIEQHCQDGTTVWVEVVTTFARNEAGTLDVVGVARNIAIRKQADLELRRARDAAEAANRAKSEFLANMSHEIRTPMTAVLGLIDLLVDSPLEPDQREYLDLARTSSQTLLDLLNDILDLSKIEADRVELEQLDFDLDYLIHETISMLTPRAHAKGLALIAHTPVYIPQALIGDPTRLRQVLVNLLGNALKFTPHGSVTLTVSLALATMRPDVVLAQFAVQDTGIGIAPAHLQAIFLPFTQADGSTTRQYGGTGLGLTISRKLVEKAGGQLSVESLPQQGSCFTFVWPLTLPESVEPPAAPVVGAPVAAPRRRHILLAEDNPATQLVVRHILLKRGWEVTVVETGRDAVQLSAQTEFDVALMDVQMADLDGFAATAAIRQREQTTGQHLPIIAVTAHAMKGDRERCLAAGMDGYLPKPIEAATMFKILEETWA